MSVSDERVSEVIEKLQMKDDLTFDDRRDAVNALRELQERRQAEPLEPPKWKEDHNQYALCVCGHPYYRHFDTYDNMRAVGCKYCGCGIWVSPHQYFS